MENRVQFWTVIHKKGEFTLVQVQRRTSRTSVPWILQSYEKTQKAWFV